MKRKSIKFTYDADVDAAYLALSRGKVLNSEDVGSGLVVDFGSDDEIIGIEILRFAKRFLAAPRSASGKAAKRLAS